MITAPLPHSPPAKKPCKNLIIINKIGAKIPTVCQVGNNPVQNVTTEKPVIVIIIAFFLPYLSPKFPKNAPPKGLIISVTTYVAKVANRLKDGLLEGKIIDLLMKLQKALRQDHNHQVPSQAKIQEG